VKFKRLLHLIKKGLLQREQSRHRFTVELRVDIPIVIDYKLKLKSKLFLVRLSLALHKLHRFQEFLLQIELLSSVFYDPSVDLVNHIESLGETGHLLHQVHDNINSG